MSPAVATAESAVAGRQVETGERSRLYFVQWLRVFLISLVVAHHAAQPYGPTGGAWLVDDPASSEWLLPFFAVNAAFFMGFFFLIAGYFTAASYDRKGGSAYVRGRLLRLGVPLAFFTLFVFGPLSYLVVSPPEGFLAYFFEDYIGRWQIVMGHLWFIAQLLALSLLYALWRLLLGRAGRSADWVPPVPGDRAILAYAVALGLVGALVRVVYPQDAWVRILWLIPAEPAHLPQYVSMFLIGVVAGRGEWFLKLPTAVGARWFAVGVVAFIVAAVLFESGVALGFLGRDSVWGLFEAFVCVGMILGLLVFFRRFLSEGGRWLSLLDANVYGVYIIHLFVVIALQNAILTMAWPALAKFAFVTLTALPICFAMVGALRKIPVIRYVV